MFLNIGQNILVPEDGIIGIFDLDNTTWSKRTRDFLERAEREGRVSAAGDGLPRSFVLSDEGIYLTPFTTAALCRRSVP